jgi:tetratricopeptide (TPR) repeat protein
MDKSKVKDHLIKINEKLDLQEYKKCNELIKHLLKHTSYSMDILLVKLRCDEALNKYEEALKTANLALFIWPNNLECH